MIIPKLRDAVAEAESETVQAALHYCKWNGSKAAKLLGVKRHLVYQKIKQYALVKPSTNQGIK
jgi:transcriptional regulator of acetoin/glycerol metabolism